MTHTSRPQAQTAVTTARSERAANGDERDHNARLVLERDPIVGKIIALAIRTEFMMRHVDASHELPGSIGARWSELVVELAKAPIPAWSAIEPADLRAACEEMLERIEERDRLL